MDKHSSVEPGTVALPTTSTGVDVFIAVPVSMLVGDLEHKWEHVEAQAKRIQQMNPAVFQAAFARTPLLKVEQAHTKVCECLLLNVLFFCFGERLCCLTFLLVRACVQFKPLPDGAAPDTVLWCTRICAIDGQPFNFDDPSEAHTDAIAEFEWHSQAIFSALVASAKRKRDDDVKFTAMKVRFLDTAIATALDKSSRAPTQEIKLSYTKAVKQFVELLIKELEEK
jgi:hypothetical protein